MKKPLTTEDDLDIPELGRDQLGKGVRGKYRERFLHASNVVFLRPEVHKAFPTSEAVNEALLAMLNFAAETARIAGRAKRLAARKRPVAG